MKPKQKTSNFTVFAILTTLTLFTWALFGVYEKFRTIDLSSVPANVLEPINPSLDTNVLDLLDKKNLATEEQISSFVSKTTSEQATQSDQPNQ